MDEKENMEKQDKKDLLKEDVQENISENAVNKTPEVDNKNNENTDLNEENPEAPKKIEVVTGDGDLTISPVYGHLEVEKPKPRENRKIFIPEVKSGLITSKDEGKKEDNIEENPEPEENPLKVSFDIESEE